MTQRTALEYSEAGYIKAIARLLAIASNLTVAHLASDETRDCVKSAKGAVYGTIHCQVLLMCCSWHLFNAGRSSC